MAQHVTIFLEVEGLDGMIKAMRSVQVPSFVVTGDLESVLDMAFDATQADVHVISGDLKASGHTSTDFDGVKWSGEINYGGSRGTKAYYAIYEMNRAGTRPDGTPHDFFSGLSAFDHLFEDAIDHHFKESL